MHQNNVLSSQETLQGKKIAVLGLGVEGQASVEFLLKKGVNIWALDRREKTSFEQSFITQKEAAGVRFVCGKNYLQNLTNYDMIVRSPGIKRLTPELLDAEKAGVTITSQIKLFFDFCPAQIIGVTGTKGKGTTASLLFAMLKEAGRDVYLGGNIGVPPLSFLDKLQSSSWVVLELSSFQLQDLHKSPHIAVMLMITSEHLDHHETLTEYIAAKRNILRYQTVKDFAVLNRDYPASNESDIETNGLVYFVSRERETNNACFVTGDKVMVRRDGNDDSIIKTSEIQLPGKHNLENVCAAVMAAKLAQIGNKAIVPVLKQFTGLPHRLEMVREHEGVLYYDDSFSTTPETAIAAIEAFAQPKVLILGGSSKGSDFTQLGKVIRESDSIKAIIGIGEEWDRIKEQIDTDAVKQKTLLIENVTTMQQVVLAATKIAQKGDIVLLSPACASFGMFHDYKERGEQFKQAVLGLA